MIGSIGANIFAIGPFGLLVSKGDCKDRSKSPLIVGFEESILEVTCIGSRLLVGIEDGVVLPDESLSA